MNTNLNTFKPPKEISSTKKLPSTHKPQSIQINSRKRGNSTNTNTNLNSKNNSKQQYKIPSSNYNDPLLSSIITQVPSKASPSFSKQFQKKSHSYSPNHIFNSMHLSLLPPKSSNKKTLVLDLDETLVHSGFNPLPYQSDIVIQLEFENIMHDIHVLVRPGVSEFLQKMQDKYEIVIFTASLSKYADPLLDIIDNKSNCSFRLFREHCTLINNVYVKDLKRLGRDIKDIVIVDNSPLSYLLHPDNGLPILSWFDDKNDKELYNMIPILDFLAEVHDVREHIKKMVIDNEILYSKANIHIKAYKTIKDKKQKANNSNNSLNDIKKDKDSINHHESASTSLRNSHKKLQQINIKIINNNITNYICNDNNKNETNQNSKNINAAATTTTTVVVKNNLPLNPLKQNVYINTSQGNNTNNNKKKNFIPKNNKHIHSFRNLAITNPTIPLNDISDMNQNGTNHKLTHHKKGESFQGQTTYHKNTFLKSSSNYIKTSSNNPKQINTMNITNVNFIKSNSKKNLSKYTSMNLLTTNKTNIRAQTSSSVNINNKDKESELKRKYSNHKLTSSNGLGCKAHMNTGRVQSLSLNFEMNGLNPVSPNNTKKINYSYSNLHGNKMNTVVTQDKELKYNMKDIMRKRGLSKSSRSNDNKEKFKYNNVVISAG